MPKINGTTIQEEILKKKRYLLASFDFRPLIYPHWQGNPSPQTKILLALRDGKEIRLFWVNVDLAATKFCIFYITICVYTLP